MCLDDVHTTTFYICLMILHEWFHFLIDKQTKNLRNGFCTTFWIYNSFGNIWLHHMHLEFPNKIWSENIFLLMFDRVFQLRNWETQIKFAFYDDKTFFCKRDTTLKSVVSISQTSLPSIFRIWKMFFFKYIFIASHEIFLTEW